MSAPLLEVGDIVAMLDQRIEGLARDLFPNAVKDGQELCVGSLSGEKGKSLRIHVGAARRGWWKDFATGEGGDSLNLIRDSVCAGDKKEALAWAKAWLGIDNAPAPIIERHRIEARVAADRNEAEAAKQRAKLQAAARQRWHQGAPIGGTLVETYLVSRGIDLRRMGRAPGALRFHPALMYGFQGPSWPAMLAMAITLDGRHVATHRTWLRPDGLGKAGVDQLGRDERDQPNDAKKVLGLYQGAHIPLWKGRHRATLRDIPPGTDVYVSEGIEDGLTAACADPSLRIIAGIALSNMRHLALPPQMGRLIFIAQRDPPGSKAAGAFADMIASHRAAGRTVGIVLPPEGTKDVNDWARQHAAKTPTGQAA